ncbi:unnamed protein product [Owenia fusiformis]|uniref:Wiskott-Aldrich syndrome protein family member n=1 Tax=Owenia fusiformis TaxID=6347 RepID=A0A8J1TDF5_OWEFU|nr:unnamed protein product [Owenia fusiformis]
MPLVKRVVEPSHLSRGIVAKGIQNELECVTNNTLANVIRQLSNLSDQAEDIFGELSKDANSFFNRANRLQDRIDRLKVKVTQLDSNVEEVSLQDINLRKPFRATPSQDQQVLIRQTMPVALQETYQQCDPPPALAKLDVFREDGKSSMKFYTDPKYFFQLWVSEMQKDTEHQRKEIKKKRDKKRPRSGGRGERVVREAHRQKDWQKLAMGQEFVPREQQRQMLHQQQLEEQQRQQQSGEDRSPRPNSLEIQQNHMPNNIEDRNSHIEGYTTDPSSLGGSNRDYRQQYNNGDGPPRGSQYNQDMQQSEMYNQEKQYNEYNHNQNLVKDQYMKEQYDISRQSSHSGSGSHLSRTPSSAISSPHRPAVAPPPPPGGMQNSPQSSHYASREDLPPPPPPPMPILDRFSQSSREGTPGYSPHGTPDSTHRYPNPQVNQLQRESPQGNYIRESHSPSPARTPDSMDLPPPPPPPPMGGNTPNTPDTPQSIHSMPPPPPTPPPFDGASPGGVPPPPPPPPMGMSSPVSNGGIPAPPPPPPPMDSTSVGSNSTNASSTMPPPEPEPKQPDARSDLLKAIQDGFKLKKVEERKLKEEKHKQGGTGQLDVQSIMDKAFEMRRRALEVSDSEGEDDSDLDDDDWSTDA